MKTSKKHYLIIMVGMSPAVITETVYQLDKEFNTPDEVVAITTKEGAAEIEKQLLSGGVWEKLNSQLKEKIKFGTANIRVIPDDKRDYSSDVKNTDDNNAMADFLLGELTQYTERADTRISFSIAGGRKSMSAMGALVMTLQGRLEDKMYHILVQEPFDNPRLKPRFYFPEQGIIHKLDVDGEVKNFKSEDAVLLMGEVPFLRCRYWFDEKNISRKSYMTMVDSFNRNQVKIDVDTKNNQLRINGKTLSGLSTLCFALFWMFAERYKNNLGHFEHGKNGVLLEDVFEDFCKKNTFKIIKSCSGKKYGERQISESQMQNLSKHGISPLNRALEDFENNFGLTVPLSLQIGKNCWGIQSAIPKENINIIKDERESNEYTN